MPVWHEAAKGWVKDGKLAVLGVTQEQHPERCRLFAQWKGFDWPILHDPINVLGSSAVPIVLAVDEHGVVRSTRPNPKTFEAEFLNKSFADVDSPSVSLTPPHPPKFDAPGDSATAADWRRFGDTLALWADGKQQHRAVDAYKRAVDLDPKDAAGWFRLGVCYRRRSESPVAEADDFRRAVQAWGTALDLDPNQYIWRRRVQQYGPRLDKPYPFYDWVPQAEADIRKRGATPVELPVRPGGAEIAGPAKAFVASAGKPTNPDPDGKVNRDDRIVSADMVVVPAAVKPGQSARVHLTLRLAGKGTAHWNNEADPLRVWVDPPTGGAVSERLIEADKPEAATSTEERVLGFEVQIPKDAAGAVRVPAYALYHLCDDDGGQCRFVRLDLTIEVPVKE